MKVAIAGITGFIGETLEKFLLEKGHSVLPLTRNEFKLSSRQLANYLKDCDAIVNLAGAPVIKRWTETYKKEILDSRIRTTQAIIDAVNLMDKKPEVHINASAIGIYDYIHDNDEYTTHYGDNFLADVVKKWEEKAHEMENNRVRTCIARFGVVLGKDGGAFPQLKQVFNSFLGGTIGNGKQAMSFIHIDDLIRAVYEMIQNTKAQGVYNIVAPNYCSNKEFTKVLAQKLKRPTIFTIPVFAMRLLYGNASEVVIGGEKVKPTRLKELKYSFNYPNISAALEQLTR